MFIEIQKNIISIVILIVLFITLINQLNWKNYINKIFFYLIGLNVSLLGLEILIILLSGRQFEGALTMLKISIGFYYALAPIYALFWLYYVNITIFQSKDKIVKLSIIPCILILINLVFVLLSYQYDLIFNINSQNIFSRGTHHYIVLATSFSILLITTYRIIKYRKQIRKRDYKPLLFFAIPPLIGGLILLFFKDINLIWNSLIISQLFIYIYIQSKITSTDFLTGLLNRREYEMILRDLQMSRNKPVTVSGIMIDINDFKDINDAYGHRIGDQVLIDTAKLLKASIRKQDYVFRIGGDEFVIIIDSEDKKAINKVVNRIEETLKDYNRNSEYDFTLSFSLGTGIYDDSKYVDVMSFFEHLDLMMYDDKKYFKDNQKA